MTVGLRLQNALCFFKLLVLISIILTGMGHLAGVPGFEIKGDVEVPDNLRWSKLWEGKGNGATAFVMGLYNVMWSATYLSLGQCLYHTKERFQVFCWLQRCELCSLRSPRSCAYDQAREPDCSRLHHCHISPGQHRLLWCSVEE